MDRIEYLMRLTHDHVDDGDEIAHRQINERLLHVRRSEELLTLARGLVALLEQDLQRFRPTVPREERQTIANDEPMPRVVTKGPVPPHLRPKEQATG